MQLVFFDLLVSYAWCQRTSCHCNKHTYMMCREKASAHTLEMAISANVMRWGPREGHMVVHM